MISVMDGTREITRFGLFLIVILVPWESIKFTGKGNTGETPLRRVKTKTRHNNLIFLQLDNMLVFIFLPFPPWVAISFIIIV
jgi:hypothetical protein